MNNIKKRESVCPLSINNTQLGLVIKVDSLLEPLTAIRDSILNLPPEGDEQTLVLAKGQGYCDHHYFPKKPRIMTETFASALNKINIDLGTPEVNIAGLLRVTPEGTNVSNLLHKSPMNAIWMNIGEQPILIKIRSSEQCSSMLLNSGYAIVMGRHKENWEVDISTFSLNADTMFKPGENQKQLYALCVTSGTFQRRSWLNALNTEISAKQSSDVQTDRDMSLDLNLDRPPLRDRLLALGAQLRNRPMIRLAPLKSADLPPDFLDSKTSLVKEWVLNIKQLNQNLRLPDLDEIIPAWETSRDGNRFMILRICFNSDEGLETMRDLLQGSKVGLVEGLPHELSMIRSEIFVSQTRFRGKRFGSRL